MIERVLGRHVGKVVDNADPKGLCRVRVLAPEVLADQESGWCRPAMPYAGPRSGFAASPPVGSMVLVEWPGGDTTREPVWSGAWWPDGDGVDGAGPEAVIIVTPGGSKIELRDEAGGEHVLIEASTGATVTMDSSGLTLAFGSQKVAMTNGSVSINDGALEVR